MLSLIKNNFASVKSEVPAVNFKGIWKNELGSTMLIETVEDGIIRGTYRTRVGQPGDEEEFLLLGFVSGDLITFTVNFGKYGSLTSWTGQLAGEKESETIKTLWHLALNVNDEEEKDKLWSAIWSGADNFTRA